MRIFVFNIKLFMLMQVICKRNRY